MGRLMKKTAFSVIREDVPSDFYGYDVVEKINRSMQLLYNYKEMRDRETKRRKGKKNVRKGF